MDAFAWDDCFITGLAQVDLQHRRLVDIINRFGEEVMRADGASRSSMEAVFAELAEYAQYHFAEEESLMSLHGIDARHVSIHKKAHDDFLEEVTRLHADAAGDNHRSTVRLLEFLTQWLTCHILGSDQTMARQAAAIAAGANSVRAFEEQGGGHEDPATRTLLQSLSRLFEQVSERNRELLDINQTLEARVAERTAALEAANAKLAAANLQLDDLAHTDLLTALPNRRFAMGRLSLEWEASVREDRPLSLMMIDADGFKNINDTHGHDAGDAVLRALAGTLRNLLRTDDTVCRLGGDEFLAICPNTSLEDALHVAEFLRSMVADMRVPAGGGEWKGSVSVGVATRLPSMRRPDQLMKAADRGVYAAKRRGRNCVDVAPPTPERRDTG